jgi:hypothetical protein
MALTKRQIIAREGKLTASRVACLMEGDADSIYQLWLELTGDPEGLRRAEEQAKELEGVWIIKLGEATEQANLDWIERSMGKISGRGKVFQHPEIPWAACTLDGWLEDHECPIEAKHNNGFEPAADVLNRYMPQFHWQMICTDTLKMYCSMIRGTREPEPYLVPYDEAYATELLARASVFMQNVIQLQEPCANPFIEPPKIAAVRIDDMTGNKQWKTLAGEWLKFRPFVQKYNAAQAELKKLVAAEAKECFGHGIRIKRNKAGALTIKEDKGDDED